MSYVILLVYAMLFIGCARADVQQHDVTDGSLRVAPQVPMNEARAAHTATTLSDGRVLVAGGCTQTGCGGITPSAEVYDPAIVSFVNTSPMSVGRVSHTATVLADGRVLVAGGWTELGTTASSEIYDPIQQHFAAHAPMLEARAAHRAVPLADGRVIVLGGETATNSALSSAETYSPSSGQFEKAGDMLHARTNHTAVQLLDGRILVTGGRQSRTSVTATAEIFDPATGAFHPTGSMAMPREKHEAVLLRDGRVLVVGGADAHEGRHATTEIYDVERGVFTAGPVMQSPRYKLASSVIVSDVGHVIVAGGAPHVEILRAGGEQSFEIAGELDGLREFTSANTMLDGSILVTGGYDGRIRPSATTWTVTQQTPESLGEPVVTSPDDDQGFGLVGFSRPGLRTLVIFAEPDTMADVLAELRRPRDGSYEILDDGLEPNLIEYAYEEYGMPFDSVAGQWARVVNAGNECPTFAG